MKTIRDVLWLWGTKVNALEEGYGFTSEMSVAQGLDILGLPRAMMCGFLPPTEEEYAGVGSLPRSAVGDEFRRRVLVRAAAGADCEAAPKPSECHRRALGRLQHGGDQPGGYARRARTDAPAPCRPRYSSGPSSTR